MKNKILLVLTLFFSLIMINSGLNKFFNYMPMPELSPAMMAVFGAFGTIKWILPLVAIAEITGGILIALPKYRALGAIVIFPISVGIVVHHAIHAMSGIGLGLVLFLINVWIIVENRDKYLPLVKQAPSFES